MSLASTSTGTAVRAVAFGALACAAVGALGAADDIEGLWEGEFESLFEPSGVTRLGDGTLLIVEDEPDRALRQVGMSPHADGPHPSGERLLRADGGLIARFGIGALDDLEGVARDAAGRVYVIGSHDDVDRRRRSDRQKLLRFSVAAEGVIDTALARDLGHDLIDAYPALHDAIFEGRKKKREALNIEALAFDRRRGELLIGLRTPVLDDAAVVVRLLNPGPYVSGDAPPAFARELLALDLDKGGLRAMSYDDPSDALLLVSRRESGGGGAFKLWRRAMEDDAEPDRLRPPDGAGSLRDVEGLATLGRVPRGAPGVLFVRDDGNPRKGRGAGWFALSRESLDLDAPE